MILNVKKHALFASEGAQVFLRTDAEATQSKDLSLRIFVIFQDVHELFTPRDSGHFRATSFALPGTSFAATPWLPSSDSAPRCLFSFGVAVPPSML